MADVNLSQRLNTSSTSDLMLKASQSGMKHSMVLTKTSNPGLSFTNRSSNNLASRKNLMSQSCIRKQPTDLESFMRRMEERFNFINKTLSQHQRELNDMRQKPGNNSFFSTNDSFFRNESFNNQLLRSVRKQFQEDSYKLRNNIYTQIDSLKTELRNECIKKPELEFMFGKFQNNISDLIQSSNVTKEINDLKFKFKVDLENMQLNLNQDLNSKIRDIRESSANNFMELTNYVDAIKSGIEKMKEESKPSFFTSNQKCYSPKLIKYKETMQRLPSSSYEKASQQVILGETIYYVDKDGYLLDANFYYLLDKNNRQIQLDLKQINLLNAHDLLR